jgi:hypothetical protein
MDRHIEFDVNQAVSLGVSCVTFADKYSIVISDLSLDCLGSEGFRSLQPLFPTF